MKFLCRQSPKIIRRRLSADRHYVIRAFAGIGRWDDMHNVFRTTTEKYFLGRPASIKSKRFSTRRTRGRSLYRRFKLDIACFLTATVGFACTFEENLVPELIMERIGGERIAPHGITRFAFSAPLMNDYVELAFSPEHGAGYHTYLTPHRDTLVLDISGMLPGKTTYTISPATEIIAESGGEIQPYGKSFIVTTYPTEGSGNGDSSTATPFEAPMYGTLENGYDTDCFVFTNISNFMVRLTFEQGVTSWTIRDGEGTVFDERFSAMSRDSILIDDSRPSPITLCLNPLMRAPDWYRIDTMAID